MPDDADLLALDQAVIDSILGGLPLPGSGDVVVLPDLGFLTRDDRVVVSARGLPGALSDGALSRTLETMDVESDAAPADLAFLEVSNETQPGGDTVRVTVSGRLRHSESAATLGLSTVQVTFRREGDRWVAEPGAVASAS